MSDWEISADTQAHLATILQQLVTNRRANIGIISKDGFLIEGFLQNGTRFSINYYKTKMVRTGKTIPDLFGQQIPEMVAAPGVFGILRWISGNSPPTDPPQPPAASGVKLISLPVDSPYVFL